MKKIKNLKGLDPKDLAELFKAYNIRCEPLKDSILVENVDKAKAIIQLLSEHRK